MARGLNDPDLEDFLSRVDELESVVKGETAPAKPEEGSISEENGISTQSQRKPVNRTVINRSAIKDDVQNRECPSSVSQSQDAFMRAVEADANERAENRRKRKEEATDLKEKGNREFKLGNYSCAVEFYTQGLDHLKDFVVLYTNRAQAYNKLEKYAEAINDCSAALKLEPNNIKAFVHLGRAEQGLGNYDAAIQTFQDILKIEKKHAKMVQDYIKAAQLAQSMSISASEAEKLFREGDTGATGVHQIVEKLKRPHQPVLYYAGGMRILSLMLNDGTSSSNIVDVLTRNGVSPNSSRAQFRTFGGFSLLKNDTVTQRVLSEVASGENLMSSERDLVCATFDMLAAAVTDNEENMVYLVNLRGLPSLLVDVFSSEHADIHDGCINLLYTISKNSTGCKCIVDLFDIFRLLSGIMNFLVTSTAELVTAHAGDFLSNITQNERFIRRFCETLETGDFEEVVSPFEKHLHNRSKMPQMVLLQSIRAMFILSRDSYLRSMMTTKKVLTAIVHTLENYTKKQALTVTDENMINSLMCLLTNLFVERCKLVQFGMIEDLKSLLKLCVELLENGNKELRPRAIRLLSRVLPSKSKSVMDLTKQNIIPKLVHLMKNGDADFNNYALKCVAVFTQQSERAARDLVRSDKELKCIRGELDSGSDTCIANAALIIGHCTQVAGFSTGLANSDIIRTLLSKTDTTSAAVKENCAIALAKLATTDERHLEQLRKLGGIGILHSCMKYVKP